MGVLSAVQAGHYLGVTERTIRNMINRSELGVLSADPVRLDSQHVDAVLKARQADALRALARGHQSPVSLARETLRVLRPAREDRPLSDRVGERQRLKLSLVPDRARLLFGTAALNAALLEDGSCRWCRASEYARVLKTWAPSEFSQGFGVLLGEPCAKCGPALRAPLMAALAERVHGGGRRPSGPAPRPTEAERQAAREWASARPVTASARPVAGDDGKALVQRRLRQVRERRKAAVRRGDTEYAASLTASARSLEADAARIDGRPSKRGTS